MMPPPLQRDRMIQPSPHWVKETWGGPALLLDLDGHSSQGPLAPMESKHSTVSQTLHPVSASNQYTDLRDICQPIPVSAHP